MRRALIAILAVLALPIAMVAPVGAQEDGPLTITPEAGSPGDVVTAVVDPVVVAENCEMDLETIQADFLLPGFVFGPVLQAWADRFALLGWDGSSPPVDFDQKVAQIMAFAFLGIGGAGPDGDATTEEYLANTFILTFADIETQEPVGETSTFDPATGFGQINVPEVAPGLWAVAATCVEPVITDESFLAAIAAGAAYLEETFGTLDNDDPAQNPIELAPVVAPIVFPPLMEPQEGAGPWTATFCVDCEPLPSQNLLDQFCGVLPGVQAVPDRLAELFGGVDINDPSTYPSTDAIEALVNEVSALLEQGDTSVPPSVQPQWSIATAELRDLVFGLTAVGFDFALLVDLSPDDAERLIEVGRGEGAPDPEFDAAVEVLTAFFVENCVPPEGAAPAATPTQAVVRFTG